MVIFFRLFVSFFIISIILSFFFIFPSRFFTIKSFIFDLLSKAVDRVVGQWIIITLFSFIFILNLSGNIPLNSIPTLFYSQTLTLSLIFWIPLVICVSFSQIKSFVAHMLPYGSPIGPLMLILPLIEIFSQFIRPFTLIIRLSTNLSRGHIIMYIFSYFTLLSRVLSPFINLVISILFILELFISLLQAYIFRSLLALYINETALLIYLN